VSPDRHTSDEIASYKYEVHQFPYEMKLKITITGPMVHNVGYRPWLVQYAIETDLDGINVINVEDNGQQTVIALIEADEFRTKIFLNMVKTSKPPLAEPSNITSEDYTGNVKPLWQAVAANTNAQINKAVPILQSICDNVKGINTSVEDVNTGVKDIKTGQNAMLEKQDTMIGNWMTSELMLLER
jgi:acylphosphatase